ncbi:hypothetical protein MUK42_32639 [Musa troglodytarum]|uniref:Uncharacterized protein n=1 Tax=Musa troglodytarum TaxID=320322 RepID=A0A9E7JTX0_9LILI|nr:hypothetical protein MUK42_32639 [Musa troglodytarum]
MGTKVGVRSPAAVAKSSATPSSRPWKSIWDELGLGIWFLIRLRCATTVKRDDAYTPTTADGVTVVVRGIINMARIQDNGFPLELDADSSTETGNLNLQQLGVSQKVVSTPMKSNDVCTRMLPCLLPSSGLWHRVQAAKDF